MEIRQLNFAYLLCPSAVPNAVIYELLLDDEELASLQQSLTSDILSAPVPSNLPSPALMPLTQRPPSSLIRFDSLASIQGLLSCMYCISAVGKGYSLILCNKGEMTSARKYSKPTLIDHVNMQHGVAYGISCRPCLTSWLTLSPVALLHNVTVRK